MAISERAGGGLNFQLDDYDVATFLSVAQAFGTNAFGYVVTPNIDHFVQLHETPAFLAAYRGAAFTLLDSRLAARILPMLGLPRFKVCPGSDLTEAMFAQAIQPDDRVLVIGAHPSQLQTLRARYAPLAIAHYSPPMGFATDPREVERCLAFVESHSPFRYCFLALGAPRQEILALQLKRRDRARGLVFCVGASIDFMTGHQVRAPRWMQRAGLEWLFRLASQPRRLAHRYLVRCPRFFRYLVHDRFQLRPARLGALEAVR